MKKVTLFIYIRIGILVLVSAMAWSVAKPLEVSACSQYDMFGCGSYGYSNYGDYYNYWPLYSSALGCGQFCGGGWGGFSYVPSQQYQYVYNQPTYRPQNQYQFVQYPYYQYTYFQNPAPVGSSDIFNYVQYPYQFYVQYR